MVMNLFQLLSPDPDNDAIKYGGELGAWLALIGRIIWALAIGIAVALFCLAILVGGAMILKIFLSIFDAFTTPIPFLER